MIPVERQCPVTAAVASYNPACFIPFNKKSYSYTYACTSGIRRLYFLFSSSDRYVTGAVFYAVASSLKCRVKNCAKFQILFACQLSLPFVPVFNFCLRHISWNSHFNRTERLFFLSTNRRSFFCKNPIITTAQIY